MYSLHNVLLHFIGWIVLVNHLFLRLLFEIIDQFLDDAWLVLLGLSSSKTLISRTLNQTSLVKSKAAVPADLGVTGYWTPWRKLKCLKTKMTDRLIYGSIILTLFMGTPCGTDSKYNIMHYNTMKPGISIEFLLSNAHCISLNWRQSCFLRQISGLVFTSKVILKSYFKSILIIMSLYLQSLV